MEQLLYVSILINQKFIDLQHITIFPLNFIREKNMLLVSHFRPWFAREV